MSMINKMRNRRALLALLTMSAMGAIVLGLMEALLLLTLLALPVLAFAAHVHRRQSTYGLSDRELRQLALTFMAGALPGAALAVALEMLLAPLWVLLCFFDQRQSLMAQLQQFLDDNQADAADPSKPRASAPHATTKLLDALQIEHTLGFYVFILALAFVVAALVEEAVKLWLVQRQCADTNSAHHHHHHHHHRSHGASHTAQPRVPHPPSSSSSLAASPRSLRGAFSLLCCCRSRTHRFHASRSMAITLAAVSGALGFSWAENVAYTLLAPTWATRLETALLRLAISSPLHAGCALMTGLRLAQVLSTDVNAPTSVAIAKASQWRTRAWVLAPAILVHGAFDYQILMLAVLFAAEEDDAHHATIAARYPLLFSVGLPLLGTVILASIVWKYSLQSAWSDLVAVSGGAHEVSKGQYSHIASDLEAGVYGMNDDDSDHADEVTGDEEGGDGYDEEHDGRQSVSRGNGELLV